MLADNRVKLVLANPHVRNVFTTIAKNRQILFKDLIGSMSPAVERDAIRASLEELKKANLIKEVEETLTLGDFDRYYVTADGLRIERQLQSIGLDVA